MFYELDGALKKKVAKNGACTEYIRDFLGRVILERITAGDKVKEIKNHYNAFHLLQSEELDGAVTTYTYDGAGRLTGTCKYQNKVEYLYDSLGRIGEVREYFGDQPGEYRATIKKYDLLDRVIEEHLQSSDKTTIHFSSYEYDYRGNRTLVQTGDQKTITEYNSLNQPCKITDSLGHATHITYDTAFINKHRQTVLQTITTDPLGSQTIDTYDTANRLVETVRLNPFGVKVGRQLLYYDLCGNKTSAEEEVIQQGKLGRTIQTFFEYNAAGEITAVIEAASTQEQKITRTKYNAFGQKESLTKPDGTTLDYTYDSFGRLKTQASSDLSVSYLYEYNLADQLTKVTDQLSGTSTQLAYYEEQLQTESLANGLVLNYTYDKTGRVRTITFPDGTGVEYCYNAVDLKEIHRIINGNRSYTHRILTHTLSGEVTNEELPGSNGQISYIYDALGRCTDISSAPLKQHIPPDGYDAAGNLLTFDLQNQKYAFTYDDTYQLSSEKGHAIHSYQFDSLYNRTLKDGEKFTHNSLNQITKDSFKYDLNGNLIECKKGNTAFNYHYDALDRLIAIEQDGTTTQFSYDSFNRCISKKANHEESSFLFQGQEEIGCWKNGICQEIRLLGKNPLHSMIAIELDGIPYIPLHDISGNVASLLSLQGKVLETYRYSAFGENEIHDSNGKLLNLSAYNNPWQYASKRLDEESGLIFFGLRMYDPSLGRWLTADPAGFVDGSNLYAYVQNNPLRYYDEFGLFSNLFSLGNDAYDAFQYNTHDQFCTDLGYQNFCDDPSSPRVRHINIENKLEERYNATRKLGDDPFFRGTKTYCVNDFVNPETKMNYNFPDFPQDKNILFNNGMGNNLKDFRKSMVYLAGMTGYNVKGVFCPTFGPGLDLLTSKNALFNYIGYEGTRELQKNFIEFDQKSSPGATMLNIPHSRGAIYTRNALIDSSKLIRQRELKYLR